MKFTDIPPDFRREEVALVNQRLKQLVDLQKEVGQQAIQYLLLTNSGGAIAVLGFIGASDAVRALTLPRVSLAFFACGVFLSGVLLALRVHEFEWLLRCYRKESTEYLQGLVERREFWDRDEARTKKLVFLLNYMIAYLGFGCFIAGGAVGLTSLISF